MIHPNMGTLLCYLTTDCAISPEMLKKALKAACAVTFNRISVDGDTSTNDSLIALANGLAGNPAIVAEGADYETFLTALTAVCTALARAMDDAEKAYLVLSDGSVFSGRRFGAGGDSVGELVFTTGMADLASRVMLGQRLKTLGYGTGLYRTPPYTAVKVPVFSFEKLADANSILGPEMKSTGEALGLGRTRAEALYKGLTAAGFTVPAPGGRGEAGVLISVEENDSQEILSLSRRFADLGMAVYATTGTAEAIQKMGVPVHSVGNADESGEIVGLMRAGKLSYIVYTGAVKDGTVGDYIALHRLAMVYLRDKYARMEAEEQRWESVQTEDAEIVLIAYGISSRISKAA